MASANHASSNSALYAVTCGARNDISNNNKFLILMHQIVGKISKESIKLKVMNNSKKELTTDLQKETVIQLIFGR